jgi:hypothetical protein
MRLGNGERCRISGQLNENGEALMYSGKKRKLFFFVRQAFKPVKMRRGR